MYASNKLALFLHVFAHCEMTITKNEIIININPNVTRACVVRNHPETANVYLQKVIKRQSCA